MSQDAILLEVRGLSVTFPGRLGPVQAATNVSFDLRSGEILGIVGESGSGKSVTVRAILRLVPPPGRIASGEVLFDGRDLLSLNAKEMIRVRGCQIGMVFQNALNALNPVRTIGDQLVEVLRVKRQASASEATESAIELLHQVGISPPRQRMKSYPHHLSGGMRQRVMIALAIAGRPLIMIGDEPTTALDVTVQLQILTLLARLQRELKMSIILVSHDLDVVQEVCDRLVVMYAGHILECGATEEVLSHPRHPYTEALLRSVPKISESAGRGRFQTIGGQPPELDQLPPGCPFQPRCRYARNICDEAPMTLDRPISRHGTACVVEWSGNAG